MYQRHANLRAAEIRMTVTFNLHVMDWRLMSYVSLKNSPIVWMLCMKKFHIRIQKVSNGFTEEGKMSCKYSIEIIQNRKSEPRSGQISSLSVHDQQIDMRRTHSLFIRLLFPGGQTDSTTRKETKSSTRFFDFYFVIWYVGTFKFNTLVVTRLNAVTIACTHP